MKALEIKGTGSGVTAISNTFIDQYMITAGSTHLKTYLMLMRMVGAEMGDISVASMADRLDCGESDVIRSLKHWEKKGLMVLEFAEDETTLVGITLRDPDQALAETRKPARRTVKKSEDKLVSGTTQNTGLPTTIQPQEGVRTGREAQEALPEKTVDVNALTEDEDFCQLLYVVESYIGKPLTHAECETFGWLYDKLHMNFALLEYLVEYCVHNNHPSVRYMETVAIDWHRKKIETAEQAKIYTPLNGQKIFAIMKALGLGNRQPAQSERQTIDGWFSRYGFPLDMYVEACNRTMINIHEPNLKYVESILSRWKEAGAQGLDQVKQLDEQRQKQLQAEQNGRKGNNGSDRKEGTTKSKGQSGSRTKAGAAMQDFEQRSYDYNALLEQLNKD